MSSWFKESGITEVGAMIGGRAAGEDIINRRAGRGGHRCGGLTGRHGGWTRRPLVLACLIQVAFDHGNGWRGMLAKQGGGEAGEVGDEALLQSQLKSG